MDVIGRVVSGTKTERMSGTHSRGHDYMEVGGRVTSGTVTEESEAAS